MGEPHAAVGAVLLRAAARPSTRAILLRLLEQEPPDRFLQPLDSAMEIHDQRVIARPRGGIGARRSCGRGHGPRRGIVERAVVLEVAAGDGNGGRGLGAVEGGRRGVGDGGVVVVGGVGELDYFVVRDLRDLKGVSFAVGGYVG